jgi:hypothetical protein
VLGPGERRERTEKEKYLIVLFHPTISSFSIIFPEDKIS